MKKTMWGSTRIQNDLQMLWWKWYPDYPAHLFFLDHGVGMLWTPRKNLMDMRSKWIIRARKLEFLSCTSLLLNFKDLYTDPHVFLTEDQILHGTICGHMHSHVMHENENGYRSDIFSGKRIFVVARSALP